jgi:hypothetical protein
VLCRKGRDPVATVGFSKRVRRNVRFHEGVSENFINDEDPCLINQDDLLNEVYFKELCHLFTKGFHHRSISVILITQNLSPGTILQRHISECQISGTLVERKRQTSIFTPGQADLSGGQCQSLRGVSRRD